MVDRKIGGLALIGTLGSATVFAGSFGWKLEGLSTAEAIYRSFLAFGGSDYYYFPANEWLSAARWFGLGTMISAAFLVVLAFAASQVRRFRIKHRKNHIVVVGADYFSFSYALANTNKSERITLVDTERNLSKFAHQSHNAGVLKAPIDFLEDKYLIEALGRDPSLIIFGDNQVTVNIERAEKVLLARPKQKICLRSEDLALNSDISLWSPLFGNVPIICELEFAARALVHENSIVELARRKAQRRPHVIVIGLGNMAISLIEELALRCHAPDQERLLVTAFDIDCDAANNRIDVIRPGLRSALELAGPIQMDGLLSGVDSAGTLAMKAAAADVPVTCIIVSTGCDSQNMEIALRVRRLQLQTLDFAAPIFVRSGEGAYVSPAKLTNLSGGIFRFGGSQVSDADMALEQLQMDLGKKLHQIWSGEVGEDPDTWEKLDQAGKRTNTRAALLAVEALNYLGFVPPQGVASVALAAVPEQIDVVLQNKSLMDALAETEHERWVAERAAEGWTYASIRDNQKKLHNLMVPWDELDSAGAEKRKDFNNVTELLKFSRDEGKKVGPKSRWRKRLRIGVLGPLSIGSLNKDELRNKLNDWLVGAGINAEDYRLEVVTPNAPGFDRIAAAALFPIWAKFGGLEGDLFRFEVGETNDLDRFAHHKVDIVKANKQSQKLSKAVTGNERHVNASGFLSGSADRAAFIAESESVAQRLVALCDLVVVAFSDENGKMTKRVVAANEGKVPVIKLEQVTYSAGAPSAAKS